MMQMQQQMMGKAGGAAPQQGMGAMNPMAAMMGALYPQNTCCSVPHAAICHITESS